MLAFPEIAGGRIDRETLLVAVAKTPDLRPGAVAADERVIRRRRAVGRNPDQLADVIAEVLRLVAGAVMVAQRDKQIAVIGLRDAAAIMVARRQRSLLAEDDFDFVEPAGEACPNGCSRPYVAEIALTGRAPGKYNLYLGGGFHGERLNSLYRENIGEEAILEVLSPMFARYAKEREQGERFGDFIMRAGYLQAA